MHSSLRRPNDPVDVGLLLSLRTELDSRRGAVLGPRSGALYVHVDDFGVFSEAAAFSDAVAVALARDLQQLDACNRQAAGSRESRA